MSEPPVIALEDLVRRIGILRERPMRLKVIRQWCRYDDSDLIVQQLESLIRRTMGGDHRAKDVLFSFADFLLNPDQTDDLVIEALDLAAYRTDASHACLLLSNPSPHRTVDDRLRQSMRSRAVPLGMRRWQARLGVQANLEALLADGDPRVVANLCQNPRLAESHIVSMTSRRPNWPDVIDAVAKSKWLSNTTVLKTIVQNPFARTGLAISLLPQTGPVFLAALRFATDLHPKLIDAARRLFELSRLKVG